MTKYVDNVHSYDSERPSLEGQNQLFRQVVAENPEKYLNLLDNIVADNNILLCYAESGVRGLLDAKNMLKRTGYLIISLKSLTIMPTLNIEDLEYILFFL